MAIKRATTGPVFDGRAADAARRFSDEAARVVAQAGVDIVRGELHAVLRHSTGYYESRIRADRVRGEWGVDDSGVVYGPWLAGVSSRNSRTHFRGYSHWRRATQRLQAQAAPIAERALPPFLREMQ